MPQASGNYEHLNPLDKTHLEDLFKRNKVGHYEPLENASQWKNDPSPYGPRNPTMSECIEFAKTLVYGNSFPALMSEINLIAIIQYAKSMLFLPPITNTVK